LGEAHKRRKSMSDNQEANAPQQVPDAGNEELSKNQLEKISGGMSGKGAVSDLQSYPVLTED
jgi:bacteriocin-like protein